MTQKFDGSEMVELAIQIEINGRDFYNALYEKSKNEKAKKVFAHLADEEEKHIARFKGILGSLKKYEPKEAYPDEYFAYMNSMASEQVFTKKDKGREVAEKTKNETEAIDLGIGFEKESIGFYEGMKKIVPKGDIKILDDLLAEEQRHLEQLIHLRGGM
ncbi:ferritin family protein [Candidatus Omnitrophota bacterium]